MFRLLRYGGNFRVLRRTHSAPFFVLRFYGVAVVSVPGEDGSRKCSSADHMARGGTSVPNPVHLDV